MRPTVLLFDIDGTLVTTGGVGRRALERVFEELYGRSNALSAIRLDGMTDPSIVKGGLAAIGAEVSAAAIERVLETYVRILEDEVAKADPARYRLHRGMAEALERAASTANVALGLGTGNIREGARLKLNKVGVYDRFTFGGFGSDHEDRPTLIRRGAERGAAQLGAELSTCRVVIVGDTPKDVAAAQAMGAESIGVGTGSFRPPDLMAVGATAAFHDLGEPGAVEALLFGADSSR
jgi:phosphoglycolate phosphatase-like HAD superfamily hydrolase